MKLNRTTRFDPQTPSRIGKLLGARYLVLGNYLDLWGTLRINADLVDVESGVHATGSSASGKAKQFLAMEQTLSVALAKAIETRLPNRGSDGEQKIPASPVRPRVKPPAKLSFHTVVRYAKALDAMDRGDRATATTDYMRS